MKTHASPAPALPAVLARHAVFSRLDESARTSLATRFTRQTFASGELIAEGATLGERLALVLDGKVKLQPGSNEAAAVTLRAGELFGAGAGPHEAALTWSAHADGAATLAFLGTDELSQLCADQPAMTLFLVPPAPAAIAPARSTDPYLSLMTTPVRALIKRAPITLPPEASIAETAQTMREQRVSSVLLIEQGHLFGLVTDRDLRNRALAAGLAPETRVLEIATLAPLSIAIDRPAFEALLLMARHNIHHVPVLDAQRVAGMLTATDLTEQLSTSAVYVAGDIYKQQALPGLVAAAARVKQIQRNLAAAEASAYSTGHIVTAITDALTARLLQLGEAQLGPAPVDYAWVAAGSQARSEQTAKSDQDNCMILDDSYDEATHGAYFKALANFVNDGLDACGYVYCPGEMMARTDEWRQPQRRWAEYFHRWTETPEPKALMLTCVFFDLRLIYGRASLLDDLRRDVLRKTRDNRIFLAYMVGNALTHRPPLSMFGGIATVRNGELRDAVDLKHSGIVPIVDLARIYALAGGHEEVNTSERLAIAAQSHEISEQGARDLNDALEFLATQRIRHQARQMDRGIPADNFLSLGELSNFERRQLKGAFEVVQTLQNVLAQRYR
jgi:CBS domain-containing protein